MPCQLDNHGMRTRNNIISLIVLFHKNLLEKKVWKFGKVSAWLPAPQRSNTHTLKQRHTQAEPLIPFWSTNSQLPCVWSLQWQWDRHEVQLYHIGARTNVHERMNSHAQTHRHIHTFIYACKHTKINTHAHPGGLAEPTHFHDADVGFQWLSMQGRRQPLWAPGKNMVCAPPPLFT